MHTSGLTAAVNLSPLCSLAQELHVPLLLHTHNLQQYKSTSLFFLIILPPCYFTSQLVGLQVHAPGTVS